MLVFVFLYIDVIPFLHILMYSSFVNRYMFDDLPAKVKVLYDWFIFCKMVNYLDVSLSLNNSSYESYHKPDNEILCVHKDSNYPPSILKQNPTSIEKRISTLSTNETIFNESKEIYQKPQAKSAYPQSLKY